jgi:asparagine synthase (glutamine-hydrolysing)
MCGIAGIFHQRSLLSTRVEAARQVLRSRGPDGSGLRYFSYTPQQKWHLSEQGTAALLQTRLSIRDLSDAGAQPMKNEEGSIWIVYNGEIYGWEQEAEELQRRGHRFISHSDTEFILHGYEEWGQSILDRLQGMFAIAILDLRREQILLARDRLGEKPLFYRPGKNSFSFASSIRALAAFHGPEEGLRWNPNAIDAFLTHRYIPAPLSIFEGIYKLPAAHRLIVRLDQGEITVGDPEEYWKLSPSTGNAAELFHESVRQRLVSDRSLGIFLSGGLDSQAIAASIAQRGQLSDFTTFTATFPNDPRYDESTAAAKIASRLGLKHQELPITMNALDAPRIIADLDEPFADPSAIPTWYLCQAAAKEIVVALAGDGGDELFAGYKRYAVHQRATRLLPRFSKRKSPWVSSQLCLKSSRHGRWQRLLLSYQLGWEEAYTLRFSALDPFTRAFLQPDLAVQSHYWRLPSSGLKPRDWMLECDRLNYLPEYILRKSDLCGMAHSLELRSPMLDHRFIEAVHGMPSQKRFTHPPKKFLQNQIGSQAVTGPKRGFNPPLHDWLQHPILVELYRDLPKQLETLTGGQLAGDRLAILMREASGNPNLDEVKWMLLVLLLSLRQLQNLVQNNGHLSTY